MACLLDLRTPNDHALRVMLGFLAHNDGKSRFALTARRGRDLHALTLHPSFTAFVRSFYEYRNTGVTTSAGVRLNRRRTDKHWRWLAGLSVAPLIRAGFEEVFNPRSSHLGVLRAASKTDDVLRRLVAYQKTCMTGRTCMHDALMFLALGFLGDARIEELLEAKLDRTRWGVVFDDQVAITRQISDRIKVDEYNSIRLVSWSDHRVFDSRTHVNTVLIDPLFSFAEWGKETVTSRYEMMAAVKQGGGWALEFASTDLKQDRELVFEAVTQHGDALRYASDELRGDRSVVIAAIKQTCTALHHASAEMKADPEVLATEMGKAGLM